jgi:hypothetical protein
MRLMDWMRPMLLTALATLVAACGGGGGGAGDAAPPAAHAAVVLDGTRTARASVGASGGEITATAADGRRYTLVVPAGALAAATELTATPVISMGDAPLGAGVKAAVRFGPAGLNFAVPATLRIEGAPTGVPRGRRLVGFLRSDDGRQMSLVPVKVAGAALELPVLHFSDVGFAEGTPAEIALIPITTPSSVAEEIIVDLGRRFPADPSPADLVALFGDVLDRTVVRELDNADRANTLEARQVAASAMGAFDRGLALCCTDAERQAVVTGLGDRYRRARERALAFIRVDLESSLRECAAPAPIGAVQLQGLRTALTLQRFAAQLALDDAAAGLDGAAVARRINDCARLAFEPLPVPGFEVGRPVSLDARVVLIFAADASRLFPAELLFTVRSSDATIASPSGLGDANGRYTTVVTPGAPAPLFDAQACVVVPALLPGQQSVVGGLVPSVMCAQQSIGGSAAIVLSGDLRLAVDTARETISIAIRLRIRAEPAGGFTVLEATGRESSVLRNEIECFNQIERRTVVVPLPDTIEATITSGRTLPAQGGVPGPNFELLGQRVERFTTLAGATRDCSTVERIDTRDSVRTVTPTRIERDGRGPTALVFGTLGRLVRE